MQGKRYPKISIGSKNELAKRISSKGLPFDAAKRLIDDVLDNFNDYWYDSADSEPERQKYVRSTVGTPLSKLLKLIDQKIMRPHDSLVPNFIFGGVSDRNHIQAAHHLLGKQRGRTLLGLDLRRFFEQISQDRVFHLFHSRCQCGFEGAKLLAKICCVPLGPKGSGNIKTSIARGFHTSPRLALWCSHNIFTKINWIVRKSLKGHDPKIAIFVDDIGIDASRVTHEKMQSVLEKVGKILTDYDLNQKLIINPDKTKIISHKDGAEHLGLKLGRGKLAMSYETRQKMDNINRLLSTKSGDERKSLKIKQVAYRRYQNQIDKIRSVKK